MSCKVHLFFCFLNFTFLLNAQIEAFTHGGTDDDIGYCFAINKQGGYVLVGAERRLENSSEDLSLLSLDEKGNVIWATNWGSSRSDIPEHIEQTQDGGYVIAGSRYDNGFIGQDGFISKVNKDGLILWLKYYGGKFRDELFSVKQTKDLGYIACGFSTSDTITSSFGEMYLVKTDSLGNKEWETFIGEKGKDIAFDIIETSDGSFMAVGTLSGFHRYSTFEFTQTNSDLLIAKVNSNGTLIWKKQFGGNQNEIGKQIKEAPDGGFYIVGSSQSFGVGSFDIYLLKVNVNGEEEWMKTFGNSGFDYGQSIDINEHHELYITGATNVDAITQETDIIALKTDENGNEIWSTYIGGDQSDYGNYIRATSDEGCAIIGNSKSIGNGGNDIFFVKIDANGLLQPISGNVQPSLLVYPNPVKEELNFHLQSRCKSQNYLYEIYDQRGSLVYSKTKEANLVQIDISKLNKGVYTYTVISPCIKILKGNFIIH
ncbi:MAG: T9SS type A sorting domain-containing protein [Crocinitomicaceae bacterium]|nr:T9SS type A sorting domain-containing protein [Crocinitomicaceae bacterium]